ncbi:DNA polymerase III delta subunit [Azonexus fungiphilus]|jgi:DNA polymerase-3 subunit delta|uniref:DNA polymerase III subunit delta n=1 Tax=Azonexus fungiphilus TaxID=146940 RepID=A0A495WFP5_9RHOO|nr:DNA polymerase III subunit delta [Azonexus fungiphilus]RKT59595.1 DNA polymerase III delta subunit [Azonexus fungiphilus]
MLLKAEQLAAHLERELRPLYVLYGDEPLLVIEAADAIRARARSNGYSEREVLTVLPQFDWGQLLAAGGNLSLFGDRKLIDLRIPAGKPGKEGSAALQQWCQNLSPDNLLLVTLPELDWREEKAAWFTALANAGVAVKLNAPPLAELPGWIAGRLRRQQQSADPESLKFIAERVEGNLLAAHQEIQKLALLYPAGKLAHEQVREAVLNVARYDIEGLREALLAGDIGRLARTLDGLMQEGEAPPLVLWAMSEEIRALATIRAGLDAGRPVDGLLKDAKVWGPRQLPVKKALQRLSTVTLEAALRHAGRIDRLIKGIGQGDLWEEFLRLGLSLCQPGKADARNRV